MKRRRNRAVTEWTREMGAYEAVYLSGDPECAERAKRLLSAARARAKQKRVAFTLDGWNRLSIQAVLERGKCELTGLPFGKGPFAPTLDRIVPADGYVPGNVRVVCRLINAALGDWGKSTLRQAMSAWLPTPPNRPPFNLVWFHYDERTRAVFD